MPFAQARANVRRFVEDLNVRGMIRRYGGVKVEEPSEHARPDYDLWSFILRSSKGSVEVMMPGAEFDEQSPRRFPRLYVGGNSWFWQYALGMVESYIGEEEQ